MKARLSWFVKVIRFLIYSPKKFFKRKQKFDHERIIKIVYINRFGKWELAKLWIDPEIELNFGRKPFIQDPTPDPKSLRPKYYGRTLTMPNNASTPRFPTPESHFGKILRFLGDHKMDGGYSLVRLLDRRYEATISVQERMIKGRKH